MKQILLISLITLCPISLLGKRPNVIVVMTDDQGYGELSVHGNPVIKTPNLDSLHSESLRLVDYHAAPMCTATRGQLMSGMDAVRNGATNVSSGRTLLRPDLSTMADYFRDNGYRTGIFGKWHLGDNYPYRPQDRGFEETLWFPSSHINAASDYWNNDYFDNTFIVNGKQRKIDGYCTDVFFDQAMSWMKSKADAGEPFFTYIPTNAPHWPFWAPSKDVARAKKALEGKNFPDFDANDLERFEGYVAMILNVDDNMGRLIDFLKRESLEDDTILIFTTDNGSTFGHMYFNAGMRGHKTELYEGGHRVPFFIRWPNGNLGQPRDIDGLTQSQDVLPSLIDLCDLNTYEATRFDGLSLGPVFLEGSKSVPDNRKLVVNYSRMPFTFEYKSPESASVVTRNGAAVLWKHWRLIKGEELYNLKNDPAQKKDVFDRHPEVVAEMSSHLDSWWEELEGVANKPQEIIIGTKHENPTKLSASEWFDVFVDTQGQIWKGVLKNGYWHLNVARAGDYEFELRRWPREADTPIAAGKPAVELTAGSRGPGNALPITSARILIDGQLQSKPVDSKDKSVTFKMHLDKGSVRLHTWFRDINREAVCGAYYVYVRYL